MITLGELLRRYRRRANLTQMQLEPLMGYDDSRISRVENGRYYPPITFIERFITVVPISPAEQEELWQVYQAGLDNGRLTHTTHPSPPANVALRPDQLDLFVTGMPIIHPYQFYGRQKILTRIFNRLERFPLQSTAVLGPVQSGKTSLLKHLQIITRASPEQIRPDQRIDWLTQPEQVNWIYVDFHDSRFQNQERLLSHILAQLNIPFQPPVTLFAFLDLVESHLQTPTILLWDNIGMALASPALDKHFWWSLRSLCGNSGNGKLAFVVTSSRPPHELAQECGKPSPFFNIFIHDRLPPLAEQDARRLLAGSPHPFTPEETAWIMAQSRCWPILLQVLGKTRLESLSDNLTAAEWRELALARIQKYRHLLAAEGNG